MFKKSHPLQSKSEIILRNIVVIAMIAFFSIFLIVPIGIAFAGSFHEWNPLSGTYNFLGLENYKEVFTSSLFGKSMLNTLIFSVVVIIFRVGLGLGIAYAIYSPLVKHKSFFRAIYYMPVVTPMVAVAFVWKFLYNPQIGAINQILGLDINWLSNPETALYCVAILTAWLNSGINFLYFSAGLGNIDNTIYERASVDGASGVQQFFHLTLPGLSPIMFYTLVVNIIQAFQSFGQIKILTEGGPNETTNVIVYSIYRDAFFNYRFGSAAAQSVILFFIVMLITLVMFRIEKKGGKP